MSIFKKINCSVIAEIGCNHLGRLDVASAMVKAAKESGADAVKFQVFHSEELYHPNNPEFSKLKREELSFDDFKALYKLTNELGLDFIATPFDYASADFLTELGVKMFKIGSGELNYIHFLRHVASKGLPVILSTGMGDLNMIDKAVSIFRYKVDLTLLHCISSYPAKTSDANLRAMLALQSRYSIPVGFSDHTTDPYAAYAAVALGAVIIEKHVTFSQCLPGDDHPASMEFNEFKDMVKSIREIESSLGNYRLNVFKCEKKTLSLSRRSPYARNDIPKGEQLSLSNIIVRRPQHSITANAADELFWKTAPCNLKKDEPIPVSWMTKADHKQAGHKILALIPARSGSKGIPHKNMAILNGKPLVQYTLEAALQSMPLSDIMLSTDSPEILDVGRKLGLKSDYLRPKELAEDNTPMADTVIHALDWLAERENIYDSLILLQPTSPLRTAEDISNAIKTYSDCKANSLASVHEVSESPYECAIIDGNTWRWVSVPPKHASRRQDYPCRFLFINGAIYIADINLLRATKRFIHEGETVLFEMPINRGIDIDTQLQFFISEQMISYINQQG